MTWDFFLRMKYIPLTLSLLFLLFGCKETKNDGFIIFNQTVSVHCYEFEYELIVDIPSQIELLDSILLFMRPGKHAAKHIDIRTGEDKGPVWHLGRGPNEFIQPYFAGIISKDSSLVIFDGPLGGLFAKYKWRLSNQRPVFELITNFNYSGQYAITSPRVLENGYTISRIISGANRTLLLHDKEMNVLENFYNPLNVDFKNDLRPLQGHLASYQNKFVFAAVNFGYICCYEVSDQGDLKLNWEHWLTDPVYDTNPSFKFNQNKNRDGFYDVKIVDDYIFALYSGEVYDYNDPKTPKNILVFSHEGQPIVHLKLDRELARVAVTPDGKTIFSFDWRNSSKLIKYDLSDVLQ